MMDDEDIKYVPKIKPGINMKENKAILLIKKILIKAIDNMSSTKIRNIAVNNELCNAPIHKILIDELFKPDIENEDAENPRNIDLIVFALEQFSWFKRFKIYNQFLVKQIRAMAECMKYKAYKKGTYICNIKGESDKFYGLITGIASVRTTTYTKENLDELKNEEINLEDQEDFDSMMIKYEELVKIKRTKKQEIDNLRYNLEVEKYKILPGMCFGETEIYSNSLRTFSVYCLENCQVFYLEKEKFNKIFHDAMSLSIYKKKIFINKCIYGFSKFHKNIVPFYYDCGDIVYRKGQKGSSMYIIYQGNFSYVTNENNTILNTDKKENLITLAKLNSGNIVGTELAMNIFRKEKCYENNLMCNSDNSMLLEINLDFFKHQKFFLEQRFKKYYEKQNLIINESIKNMEIIKRKRKLNDKVIRLETQKLINKYQEDIKEKKKLRNYLHSANKNYTMKNSIFVQKKLGTVLNLGNNSPKRRFMNSIKKSPRERFINKNQRTFKLKLRIRTIENLNNSSYNQNYEKTNTNTSSHKNASHTKDNFFLTTYNNIPQANFSNQVLCSLNMTTPVKEYSEKSSILMKSGRSDKTTSVLMRTERSENSKINKKIGSSQRIYEYAHKNNKSLLKDVDSCVCDALNNYETVCYKDNESQIAYNSGSYQIPLLCPLLGTK